MTSPLVSLDTAVLLLISLGANTFSDLRASADSCLDKLRQLELAIEAEIASPPTPSPAIQTEISNDDTGLTNGTESSMKIDLEAELTNSSAKLISKLKNHGDLWYKSSISALKSYNTQINHFQKNVTNNPKMSIDLNDGYIYPLQLDNFLQGNSKIRQKNHTELIKAIILHLLKTGNSHIARLIMAGLFPSTGVESNQIQVKDNILVQFSTLDEIIKDILQNHNLEKALHWIIANTPNDSNSSSSSSNSSNSISVDRDSDSYIDNYNTFSTRNTLTAQNQLKELEFQFHILQYALLLNGKHQNTSFLLDLAHEAYQYLKKYFPQFYANHNEEISLLLTLLLLEMGDGPEDEFEKKKRKSMADFLNRTSKPSKWYSSSRGPVDLQSSLFKSYGSKYTQRVFSNFKDVETDESLFVFLANEFTSAFCQKMMLLNESSIFQAMLSGFVNIGNFFKYQQIQKRLGKKIESLTDDKPNGNSNNGILVASLSFELPFPLSNSKTDLFHFHPIFICPVSREQAEPLSVVHKETFGDDDVEYKNPVVVLKRCLHLALRDSLWQLSRRGTESFKCHYCYKKHKFSDVSEVYFIDL